MKALSMRLRRTARSSESLRQTRFVYCASAASSDLRVPLVDQTCTPLPVLPSTSIAIASMLPSSLHAYSATLPSEIEDDPDFRSRMTRSAPRLGGAPGVEYRRRATFRPFLLSA